MRAKRTVRVPTATQLVVGASVLAFPATALAVNSNASTPATIPAASLHSDRPLTVGYDHETVVRGSAPVSAAGTRVELEYRPANARHWHSVDTGRVSNSGRFSLAARLARSGQLQVVPTPVPVTAVSSPAVSRLGANQVQAGTGTATTPTPTTGTTPTPTTATTPTTTTGTTDAHGSALRASAVRPVTVRPELKLAAHTGNAIVGQSTAVSGRLLPAVDHRNLVLEVHQNHRWIPVAHGRTGRGGTFTLRYTPASVGDATVHVAFAGDRVNAAANSATEAISGMHYAEVSWYYDAGDTACGFHATYGMASRTLPCGTKVTLSYGGRSVVATVDDRGPFVYSRLYDLNQNTAGALGMSGVATVLASV